MTEADRMRFAQLMHRLHVGYPTRYGASTERIALYFRALMRWQIETLEYAAYRYAEHGRRFPTTGELAAEAKEVRRPTPPGMPALEGPRADPAHAKAAFALIKRIRAGKLPPAARLVELRRMAAQFPGHGWGNAADELAAEIAGTVGPRDRAWRETAAMTGKKAGEHQ